ncbi:MAG: hypothetical protein ACI4RK_06000 [Oscillospiraceae bacterium]
MADLQNINIRVLMILLLVSAVLAYGLYQVASEFISMPSSAARKAVLSMKKTKTSFTETLTIPAANFLSKKIHLNAERRSTLEKKLYSADIQYSPEFFIAKSIAEGVLVALFSVPVYFLAPLMGFIFKAMGINETALAFLNVILPITSMFCIIMGIMVYVKRIQELDQIIKKKGEKIDGDLVLFASTIKQQLAYSRDVMSILQSYRKICSPEFTHELDKTIADMKTGNYETALRHLESRVPSVGLSEIIRGLLAVMRGDDQRGYFEMLTHDLTVKSKEDLKRAALKRPDKLKPVTVLLLCAFMAMYLYVIILQIAEQMSTLF